MKFGVGIFPTEDAQVPAELARMAEERGFESLLFPEHTHIPASRATPYPAGGELPPEYSPHIRPVRRADGRGGRDRAAADRDRDLPRHRARSDHHRQGGRVARPSLGRAVPVRRRRGLERRGDGEPRHRPVAAVRDDARADRGDEGDLVRGRGELLGSLRQLRADLVLAEAAPAAAPADPRRRQRPAGDRPRARLRRRMDAEPHDRRRDDRAVRGAAASAPSRPGGIRSRSRSPG